MNRRRVIPVAVGIALLALLAWGVTIVLERLARQDLVVTQQEAAPPAPQTPQPQISATLFYATPGGDALIAVRREVPLAEGLVAQGRQILTAQLQPAPQPYLSPIPAGTTLRAFYLVADSSEAFVDLSPELSTRHPGGSLTELLTVQAIVNAVTANLPAVQRVQITIDGKEVDTVAGHVDVRRPLTPDTSLVRAGETAP